MAHSIYDSFMEKLAAGAAALRVGDPASERTQVGPLITARHRDSIESYVAMGVADGDFVRVSSRRGTIELRARLSHRDTPGTCFMPFHFREAAANLLTIDEIDPMGKIPEFKFCAVRIERAGSAARHEPATAREGA